MRPKLLLVIILLPLLALPFGGRAASEPQAFITWKAKTYVPAGFPGKILPGSNSPILASLEVVDGNRIADLSGQKIYWYLNDNLLSRGAGLASIALRTPSAIGGGAISLRVQIPEYPSGPIYKTVSIPIVPPSIVIQTPTIGGRFSGSGIIAQALPYYFSVQDASLLSFSWKVNGDPVKVSENPDQLQVNINDGAASGSKLTISVSASNPAGSFESATTARTLIYSL